MRPPSVESKRVSEGKLSFFCMISAGAEASLGKIRSKFSKLLEPHSMLPFVFWKRLVRFLIEFDF